MQLKTAAVKIEVPEGAFVGWPVAIRIKAQAPLKARRKSGMFPDRSTHEKHTEKVLRMIELHGTRPCRRAPDASELLMAIHELAAQDG